MEGKMLLEYLKDKKYGIYEDAIIEDVNDCNGIVFFNECSACGHYKEQHSVSTFDLVKWLYGKFSA